MIRSRVPFRLTALVVALAASALTLTACISEPVTASGTGTVTISWSDTAAAYDPGTGDGDTLLLCDPGVDRCYPDNALYAFYPEGGSSSAVLFAGVAVGQMPLGSPARVGLPAGRYTLQAWVTISSGEQQGSDNVGEPLAITIGEDRDLTLWHQSLGRAAADTPCPSGWTPSWAQWPNAGTGGFVCNRQVYAYYPDEPVVDPAWATASGDWITAVARPSSDAACPEGWSPSWAQWPNAGAGGYVCVSTGT